jgi:predicted GNAT superfamily acetyltransferase
MTSHPITAALLPALHRLNQDHAVELSSLTAAEFEAMVNDATYARAVGTDGLILTFDRSADYHSPNFRWFCDRYDKFLYVDRIVISPTRRGEGLARALYEGLFEWARDAGYERIVAEYNIDPPNPGSEAFHNAFGFEAVGEATLAESRKQVRYVSRALTGY